MFASNMWSCYWILHFECDFESQSFTKFLKNVGNLNLEMISCVYLCNISSLLLSLSTLKLTLFVCLQCSKVKSDNEIWWNFFSQRMQLKQSSNRPFTDTTSLHQPLQMKKSHKYSALKMFMLRGENNDLTRMSD